MSELVSVLMPVYNREKYVKDAIRSILLQTHKNFNLIIYDDGSTDKTVEKIKKINDDRITLLVGEKNKGVSFARNKLLEACNTKYALWQDSDDLSNIYRIEMQYESIKKTGYLTYARYRKLYAATEKDFIKKPEKMACSHLANASAMFVVNKKVQFNEKLLRGEDVDWNARMRKYTNENVLDYVLYYIRFHRDRLSIKYRNLQWWKQL